MNAFGEKLLSKLGTRLVYCADEFYLKAGRDIPDADYYEDYPQLENGVGMIRSFSDEFSMCIEDLAQEAKSSKERTVSLATGVAAYPTVKELSCRLMAICPGLTVNIYKIINNFFGESITVSGLLTGKDIYEQLKDKDLGDELIIPENALRFGEDVFLCNMTVGELSDKLSVKVRPSGSDGYELARAIISET